jgi:hypothetical protein
MSCTTAPSVCSRSWTIALFDRRCRTHTALEKLAKLRARVRRFKEVGKTLQKLFSPSLEKALTFLDDKFLPSTSNAVERGNRRYRKMQKTVYRVRALKILKGRVALDMLRDSQAEGRLQTLKSASFRPCPERMNPVFMLQSHFLFAFTGTTKILVHAELGINSNT